MSPNAPVCRISWYLTFRLFPNLLYCCSLAAVLALVTLPLVVMPLTAQHLVNDALGQFTNSTGATVRFRAESGEFRNGNPASEQVRNDGTIEFLGAANRFTGGAALGVNEALRVGGLVRYASSSATTQQQIQARWYSNLALDGIAQKRIESGVYVGGESSASGIFTASGGVRFYNGTFFYDNVTAQTLLGGEDYQNLEILRGIESKRISAGASVRTRGTFRQNSSNEGGLQVFGALSIGSDGLFPQTLLRKGSIEIGTIATGSVHNTLLPTLSIRAGRLSIGVRECSVYAGLLTTHTASASMLIQTGANVRLYALSSVTSGSLQLGFAGNELIVSGNLRNDLVSSTNTTFHTESTVRYNASQPQSLMPTSRTHPYGNLTLENSDKTVFMLPQSRSSTNQVGIALAGSLRVSSALVDMGAGELTMLTPSADAVFTGQAEVQGAMRRVMSSAVQSYTFNNAQTRFMLASGATPRDMTLTILPRREASVYDAVRDVRRRVRWEWSDGNGSWTGALRLGYRKEEIVAPFLTSNEISLGMFALPSDEALSTPHRLGVISVERSLAASNSLGFVEYQGLTSQVGTLFSVVSGDELLLRGGRELVQSIRDGRWSNPATWNIAREPDAGDSVRITHTVHVGFRRNALDGAAPLGQIRERGARSGDVLAQSVTIAQPLATNGDTARPSALMFGSFAASDTTFADEAPPTEGRWNLTSATVRIEPSAKLAVSTNPAREQLQRLRGNTFSEWQGLVVFAPASAPDSTRIEIGNLQNALSVANGGRIDVAQNLVSTGIIRNNGRIYSRSVENIILQDSIGAWVTFSGNAVGGVQSVPTLTYTNLGLSGRSLKQLVPQSARHFIVSDSLQTSRDAVLNMPPSLSIEAHGGVFHDGTIRNASHDALLRMNGVRRQVLRGEGSIDVLSVENARGVQTFGAGLTLLSALNLVRGDVATSLQSNFFLADNAVITRFPQSSLAVQPVPQGRVLVRTRGDSTMTATGELLLRLAVLDVRNRGGYRLTSNLAVTDSLTLSSRLWTETADSAYTLDFAGMDEFANPHFAEDSAEIVGTVRRTIPNDTIVRLFNNRYTSLQAAISLSNQPLQASVRVQPEHFPSPTSDSAKIRRGVEITLTNSLGAQQNALLRIGYAWRTEPQDETNDLEAPRILLQHWNSLNRSWQTNGTPFRATPRSAWNNVSDEGFWQYGVMDSVLFLPSASRFFALGVDSTRTLVPTAFFTMRAFLEGAYLSDRRMKTFLRDGNVLPYSIDSTGTAAFAGASSSKFFGQKGFAKSLPADAVDWVLVELRPATGVMPSDSMSFFLPALLKSNGALVSPSLQPALSLELPETLESGGHFLVMLHHRNHLPVQWRDTLEIAPQRRFTLDWGDTARVLGGSGALRRFGDSIDEKPVFTLIAGDVSDEQHERWSITRFDYDAVMSSAWRNILREGYLRHDADADGIITTRDVNLIWNNRNKRRER